AQPLLQLRVAQLMRLSRLHWMPRLAYFCFFDLGGCGSSGFLGPFDELRRDRELEAGQAHRRLGEVLGYDTGLQQRPAALHDRDPGVRRALAAAGTGLGRLLRDRLAREKPDPDLAAALDVVGHRPPRRFDLAALDPGRLERDQPVVAERQGVAGRRRALAPTTVDLAKLHPLGHQHGTTLPPGQKSRVPGPEL